MLDLLGLLNTIAHTDSFRRVDDIHPLDLYIGVDELSRWTLLLISATQPPAIASSKMIFTKSGKRHDGRWTLSFSLVNDSYKDLFILLCEDIVESSRNVVNKEKGIRFVVNRYKEWREMLANSRGNLLSPDEVKGLLGEMFFLKVCLAEKYGIEKAALSWTGPRHLPQDFVVDDTWYEVKTISSSKNEISISSIEQLDCTKDGTLAVVSADKTSVTNQNGLNINQLFASLISMIPSDDDKYTFSNMLLQYGFYPRKEYETEEYTYEIKMIRQFSVTANFPCLRRNNLPVSVIKAVYSLDLSAVSAFRKE